MSESRIAEAAALDAVINRNDDELKRILRDMPSAKVLQLARDAHRLSKQCFAIYTEVK
jgi:hypothetical protein